MLADGMTGPPGTVARHAAVPDTLPVGAPGKVGVLELGFALAGDRTELTRHVQRAPLHTTRPLYPDPDRPHMPHVLFMSSGGGILQGDRYRIELDCGPGTSVHFTTQTATRLYRMEHDYATQTVELRAAANSYVEYLPETTIPFAGSRFYQRTNITADPDATIVLGEKLMAGRLAHGERHAYTVYCTDLEVRSPDGRTLFADPLRFVPSEHPATGPAVMDDYGLMASLYVLTPRAREAADAMHAAIAATGLLGGASVLPGDHGAWARLLGGRSPEVDAAFRRTCEAVRGLPR
ncbi:urease accessory protein UreD [Actinomadura algeriensis]|uniref:Urease accessory protein UreD n=1 Tax=Actinomadura algeriensis TaxID=1679523 RepID=A0ABR9JKT6_9ACTN|nr:urease accessory protein UreD [Actinomadura algeriensis]MBE1531169.1 urease accessory protein [Actinomadura algeriensis]